MQIKLGYSTLCRTLIPGNSKQRLWRLSLKPLVMETYFQFQNVCKSSVVFVLKIAAYILKYEIYIFIQFNFYRFKLYLKFLLPALTSEIVNDQTYWVMNLWILWNCRNFPILKYCAFVFRGSRMKIVLKCFKTHLYMFPQIYTLGYAMNASLIIFRILQLINNLHFYRWIFDFKKSGSK